MQAPARRTPHAGAWAAAQPRAQPSPRLLARRAHRGDVDAETASSRRALLAAGGFVLALPAAAARAESPYAEVLPEVGLLNGRLRPCSSTFNCVSTASKSADQYAGPWSVPAGVEDATAAAGLLVSTLRTLYTAEVVASEALPGGQAYRRVEIQGKYSTPDVVEFLVKPSASMGDPNKRDGQLIVTFRSCAGGVKFVYPFMTPLSDGGLQPQRLNALREKLGWGKVGCELAECYAG